MQNTAAAAAPALPVKISYSVEEAVEATGIGRSYIYLALKHGELASLKLGKRRLIMRDDLLTWLASKRAA